MAMPTGARPCAALSSSLLNEPLRKLPVMAITRMAPLSLSRHRIYTQGCHNLDLHSRYEGSQHHCTRSATTRWFPSRRWLLFDELRRGSRTLRRGEGTHLSLWTTLDRV